MEKQNAKKADSLRKRSSLTQYSRFKRIQIYLIAWLLYWTITIISKSIKFEVIGWEDSDVAGWESFESAYPNRPTTINAFWHDRIFLMTYFWRNHRTSVMVSQSFDGEYITRTAQRFGYGVIRGSSTRGGSKALRTMIDCTREGESMTITVDGPRGPRYVVKSGAIVLASKTGVPIVPVLIEPRNCYTINSWDKLQIPKPFTRARVYISEPIFVKKNIGSEEIETEKLNLQAKLDEMAQVGKQWSNSKP